jgi:hypothetical protein
MANTEKTVIVMLSLLIFGIGYNRLMTWLEKTGRARGYRAFLAASGALVTLGGAGFLIGWLQALLVLACFTASGLPLIVGSTWRYMEERYRDEQAARREAEERLGEM